jgi:hypothetical protein
MVCATRDVRHRAVQLDEGLELAARGLRQADAELSRAIDRLDRDARAARGADNDRVVDEWLDHMHAATFQGAAHSMAAVGMLAPLVESMFKCAFPAIRDRLIDARDSLVDAVRPNMPAGRRWDCRFARSGGQDLVRGVVELLDDTGLSANLPADLKPTLGALFGYRNKMLHCGFEWPEDERRLFGDRIAREWPSHWFKSATTDELPWMFYMSESFVDHCVATIDEIIVGLGRFVRTHG